MRMVWKTLRLRHIGLAFFWACSMLTFRSSILLVGSANTPEIETLVVIASFVVNMTVLFAIAARIEGNPHAFERLPAGLFCASIIVGISLLHGAGYFETDVVRLVMLFAGAAFSGIGYGYFWGGWAEYLGRMHPSRTSFYIPVAFLLTAALFIAISFATEMAGIPALLLMIPLPLLSLVCLLRCRREVPDGHYARSTGSKRYLSAITSLITLIVASLVLSCLFGFVWEYAVLSVGSVNEAHQTPLVANLVVAVGLVGLVLYAHKRIDLALAFRVIVPVIVLLFVILPFFWDTNPIMLNAVMSACYGAFDVIIWYMVASTAYDFAVSGFVIGAIVRALSILARLVGIGIGYVVMLIPDHPPVLIIGVSIGAVYALAMIALFNRGRRARAGHKVDEVQPDAQGVVHPDSSLSSAVGAASDLPAASADAPGTTMAVAPGPPSDTPGLSAADASVPHTDAPLSPEAVFEMIAEDYSLTRREAEVLPYLARGRSAKVIADALYVSENTIRTHTRRILEKTDLHSKQQLIDLIDQYQ
ncbi:helix-turn-helix transcriptional regulator [Raoultibacter phocaeensis]|uniref:helix-turn-helix transcriptional regulator n=1 Tax=Raoultibacter phocaeensis TaxID=2479841 RepID=UPI003F71CE19